MDQGATVPRRGADRDTLWSSALIFVRLVILVAFLIEIGRGNFGGPDIARFQTIAHLHGMPWRDYQVEYAPLEFLLIKGLFGVGLLGAAARLAILAFIADLATWAGIRSGWGKRAGCFYLAIGLPVAILELQRIDLVPVAITVWAFVLAEGRRQSAAGAALGAAVLMKVWPLVLTPGMWVAGRARAARSFVAVTAVGVAGWIVWGGTGALSQVLSFRGATGWEAGSTVGSLVWVIGGGRVRLEAGAARVATAPGWAKALLGIALVVVLAAVWRRPGGERHVAGRPALTSVAALLLLSPVLSTQYVLWLLPWTAVAALEEDQPLGTLAIVFAIGVCTAVVAMFLYGGPHDGVVKAASLARSALLAALVVRGLLEGSPEPAG